ncbi:MAG: thymidine kinase [Saprospiraceae bacterium]|nr:thymidine kinase [Saprospiraceae bacterium]
MFLEPHYKGQRSGWIEVICGSMFSGKTEELIRRLKRSQYAYQRVMVFKPSRDTRYDEFNVVSHDSNIIGSTPVRAAKDIIELCEEYEVIGIDEAQFFDAHLVSVCQDLALKGKRVIVAGLDMDFAGRPFGPIPDLLAVAEYITKVHAICVHCGNLATHSYRLTENSEQILLGAKDLYEPRCRVCYLDGNLIDFNNPERNL